MGGVCNSKYGRLAIESTSHRLVFWQVFSSLHVVFSSLEQKNDIFLLGTDRNRESCVRL